MNKNNKYLICLTEYYEDCIQEWFFEKHDGIVGWSDDMNYCATKFSYKDALKELSLIKKTCGYGWPRFLWCEVEIIPEY